ncbi:MAG: ubiquitin-like protein, partial [Promethearchaeota archaeon]
MRIEVVPAIGGSDPIALDVEPNTTVGEIRNRVAQMRRIPSNIVILAYRGAQLTDEQTVKSVGITPH